MTSLFSAVPQCLKITIPILHTLIKIIIKINITKFIITNINTIIIIITTNAIIPIIIMIMSTWAQGMRSSSRGSYSNWARTKMSQGGGADRYEGTIWKRNDDDDDDCDCYDKNITQIDRKELKWKRNTSLPF